MLATHNEQRRTVTVVVKADDWAVEVGQFEFYLIDDKTQTQSKYEYPVIGPENEATTTYINTITTALSVLKYPCNVNIISRYTGFKKYRDITDCLTQIHNNPQLPKLCGYFEPLYELCKTHSVIAEGIKI